MRTSSVSATGVAASAWLPVDFLSVGRGLGLYLDLGAGCTASVEITPDNVLDPAVTPVAWPCNIAALTAAAADASGFLQQPCYAVRINQTVGANTTTLRVVPAGAI